MFFKNCDKIIFDKVAKSSNYTFQMNLKWGSYRKKCSFEAKETSPDILLVGHRYPSNGKFNKMGWMNTI